MADFTQLSRMARLFSRLSPGLEVKPLLAELKERVVEELDYRLEADAQRTFATAYAGDPLIAVPRVVASAPKIVVSEWMDGTPLSRIIASGSAEQRDRPARCWRRCTIPRPNGRGCCTRTRTPGTSACSPTAASV